MQERKEIREMFEKKHKFLAKEHALKNAIQLVDVMLKRHTLIDKDTMKLAKVSVADLVRLTISIAKDFEAYIRGEDFIKENLEFSSAGDYFDEGIFENEKTENKHTKNSVQNKKFRK